MSRADLEAAAAKKYPDTEWSTPALLAVVREAYIQGRLDQAEADAKLAEEVATETGEGIAEWVAAEIRKGVE